MATPPVAPTVQDLIDATLSLVDESQDSPVGQYDDGDGNILATTAQTITSYLRDGAAHLCRTCLYYPVTATRDLVRAEVGAWSFFLSTIQDGNGSYVRSPSLVAYNGVSLPQCTLSGLVEQGLSVLTDAPSTPQKWYRQGNLTIGLYPRPVDAGVIVVYGPGVAPIPSDVEEPIIWCMPDHVVFLTYYAAERLTMKNLPANAVLSGKVPMWQAERAAAEQRCAAELALECPEEYGLFFRGKLQQFAPAQPQQEGQ